ncbi:stage III sporulation protein AD [Candidatus Borkfalkia ceftriaxoniphila]|jgi:stage III sporulation protein AD|uniref:Stage III sporulation protein AD n=1 Tax=Candidatus Borkfalkia ceftriaxoniphila TaxID=2508949 RepID=A0A4Q2K814_9FIRM|nr:SpoIIIAC/SpoIIIAD family protein [Candidatus Borkfalkia ceftriaxoniphila]RXZ58181.1 stage III sporulation protein AD [Candidatus Borkfalkia ceftriaxoniphila]
MELAKIIGVGLVTAIAALILKSSKPELAFAVTIAGGVIILIFALDMLGASLRIFTDIAEKTGIDQSLVKIILKIVAIGYLVEFSAGIVEDFGSKSIADKLVLAGKIIIFTVSIPIIQSLITLIGNILELI